MQCFDLVVFGPRLKHLDQLSLGPLPRLRIGAWVSVADLVFARNRLDPTGVLEPHKPCRWALWS